jgi:hypothetical protein
MISIEHRSSFAGVFDAMTGGSPDLFPPGAIYFIQDHQLACGGCAAIPSLNEE